MRKTLHIIIALILIGLSFIKIDQNLITVLIIMQAFNFVFLIYVLKKETMIKIYEKHVNKVNDNFLLVNIILSIFLFILHYINQLPEIIIEISSGIIFSYSLIYTVINGLSLDKMGRDKYNIVSFIINSLMIGLISYSLIMLKDSSHVYLIDVTINDFSLFMKLTILGKFIIDIIVAFNLCFTKQ